MKLFNVNWWFSIYGRTECVNSYVSQLELFTNQRSLKENGLIVGNLL